MPMAGVLIIQAPAFDENEREAIFMQLESALDKWEFRENYPWISIVDQVSEIDNERLDGSKLPDFLWLTFTRSDPARDIFGLQSFIQNKHWGCHAPIIVDARVKPHHQKSLTIPNEIKKRAAEILKQEL